MGTCTCEALQSRRQDRNHQRSSQRIDTRSRDQGLATMNMNTNADLVYSASAAQPAGQTLQEPARRSMTARVEARIELEQLSPCSYEDIQAGVGSELLETSANQVFIRQNNQVLPNTDFAVNVGVHLQRDRLGRLVSSWTEQEEEDLFREVNLYRRAKELTTRSRNARFWDDFIQSTWEPIRAAKGYLLRSKKDLGMRMSKLNKSQWELGDDGMIYKLATDRTNPTVQVNGRRRTNRFEVLGELRIQPTNTHVQQVNRVTEEREVETAEGGNSESVEPVVQVLENRDTSAGSATSQREPEENSVAEETAIEPVTLDPQNDEPEPAQENPENRDTSVGPEISQGELEENSEAGETATEPVTPNPQNDEPEPARENPEETVGRIVRTRRIETSSDYELLKAKVKELLPKVRVSDIKERRALKFDPKQVSSVMWYWCGKLFRRHTRKIKSLKRINVVVYTIGKAIECIQNTNSEGRRKARTKWYATMKVEEKNLRRYIGYIHNELNRRKNHLNPTRKQLRNYRIIAWRYRVEGKPIRETEELIRKCESLKGRLSLIRKQVEYRLDLDNKSRIRTSKLRNLLKGRLPENEGGSAEVVRDYWEGIVGKKRRTNVSERLEMWERDIAKTEVVPVDASVEANQARWTYVVKKAKPFRAPGPDGIPNILWKKIGPANKWLFKWVSEKGRRKFPKWLTKGRVILLPKAGDLSKPENYRPIACLNTCYKLISGYYCETLWEHLQKNKILPENQMALRRNTWGCTHASVLDRTIIAAAKHRNRGLYAAWIDYAKAFDSVPHKYLRYVLKASRVPQPLISAVEGLMKGWEVRYEIRKGKLLETSRPLRIRNGVPQGDTLSPLLFCVAVAPISHALNSMAERYTCEVYLDGTKQEEIRLNHIFYMDDLKLYSNTREGLEDELKVVRDTSGEIGLQLNAKKCAIVGNNLRESADPEIPILGEKSTYKYLGISQRFVASQTESWARIETEVGKRYKAILENAATFAQIRYANNVAIIPVAKYLFANLIVSERGFKAIRSDARKLDTKIRDWLRKSKVRNAKSNVDRLYLPSKLGGLGFKSLEQGLIEAAIYTWAYILCKADLRLSRILLQKDRVKNTVVKAAQTILTELELNQRVWTPRTGDAWVSVDGRLHTHPTKAAQTVLKLVMLERNRRGLENWKSRPMAGRVAVEPLVDQGLSYLWLEKGRTGWLAIRNAIGTQEGTLNNRIKSAAPQNRLCRRCRHGVENEQHIVVGCPTFKNSLMLIRHNNVARVLYYELCRKYGLRVPHHTQPITPVTENEKVKILYDVPVDVKHCMASLTNDNSRTVYAGVRCNRPDLVIFDKVQKAVTVVEVGVCWFSNLQRMEDIKYHKYATNSTVEDELELANPATVKTGPNLKGLMGEMYGKDYPKGVKVVPIVLGASGEVKSNIVARLKEMGFSKKKLIKELVTRMQLGVVVGTSLVIKAHLCCKPA